MRMMLFYLEAIRVMIFQFDDLNAINVYHLCIHYGVFRCILFDEVADLKYDVQFLF